MKKSFIKYGIILTILLIILYYLFSFILHLDYYPKYKNLPIWQIKDKEIELLHSTNELDKNINIYKDIINYINKNNIKFINFDWFFNNEGDIIYFNKLEFIDSKNIIQCFNSTNENICLNNGKNIFNILNNINMNSVSKYHLKKDGKIGSNIEYYTEKGYIYSFKKDVIKIERRLYDSYRYYEKGRKVEYNENLVKIDEKGNKVIKLDNEIITIYDDNWVIINYIYKYKLD